MPARDSILELKKRIGESVVGQRAVIDRLLIALLADGHVLMEGLPGLAKTRTIKTLAKNLESEFRRIRFTPDLLPADVTGSEMYYDEGGNRRRHRFSGSSAARKARPARSETRARRSRSKPSSTRGPRSMPCSCPTRWRSISSP